MDSGLEEIRINDNYVSRLKATYPGNKDEESTPNVRCENVRTDVYLSKLKNMIEPSASEGLMPSNCRFIKAYQRGTIVVIEEPPAMRSLRIRMDMSGDAERLKSKDQWEAFGYENFFKENSKPYVFMLAMPYVVHVILLNNHLKFSRGKVFFRTQPLLGPADNLYRPPLLNISGDMGVCYGDDASKGPTGITRAAEDIVRVFWSAEFNPDYIDNYHKYAEVGGVCDYFTWQYYTQTNPMFIYNVDWIPYEKKFGEVIDRIVSQNELHGSQMFGYQTLREVFHKSETSEETVKVGRLNMERALVYDVASQWYPDPDLVVQLGDPLNYSRDRIAYIDCLIGVVGSSSPMFVRLLVDGKLIVLKLSRGVNAFIAEKVKELRHEAQLQIDDLVIKAGDIISVKNRFDHDVYKKVHYIRKASDDKLEVRIGSEFWFADTFDWSRVKKIDISNPEIDGMKIDKDKVYTYYTANYAPPSPISRATDVKFSEVTAGRNNELLAKFKENHGDYREYSLNLSGSNPMKPTSIYENEGFEDMPQSFFVGRTLSVVYDQHSNYINARKHKELGVVISVYDRLKHRINSEVVGRSYIQNDGTKFHAESNNNVVDFEIGDKVVVADWRNPLNVLKIKAIQSFVFQKEERTIDFMLVDKHGNLSQERYLDGYRGYMKTGKIRKVTNELNGVTIGTKIIAKEARISCFPKNASNIIVAFIIDTGGEPLALCSNGCTLWFSDLMEKFEHIPMKDAKWAKLKYAPLDPTKIKLQPGDIINGTMYYNSNRGYLMVKSRHSIGFRAVNLEHYHEFDEYSHIDDNFRSDMILDCIPNPRLTIPQQREKGYITAFPNFHGGLTPVSNNSPYQLIDETGRF